MLRFGMIAKLQLLIEVYIWRNVLVLIYSSLLVCILVIIIGQSSAVCECSEQSRFYFFVEGIRSLAGIGNEIEIGNR